eukprot:scaffold7000_cov156-Skeletonema_dohrnii-CCMP3373.AAC.1
MGRLEEAHDEFASVRMPCEAELWRDSSEREQKNGVVAKEESAEHWTHAAKRTYYPDLEEYGIREEGAGIVNSRHRITSDSTISHCREKSDSKGLLEDFIRLQEFSMLQGADARTGFIWEIHTNLYKSNLFDRLLPPPSAQVQELPGYEDKMLPELQTYYHFHPEEAHTHKRRCTYTNNNPMQLQPTSMVSLVFF